MAHIGFGLNGAVARHRKLSRILADDGVQMQDQEATGRFERHVRSRGYRSDEKLEKRSSVCS